MNDKNHFDIGNELIKKLREIYAKGHPKRDDAVVAALAVGNAKADTKFQAFLRKCGV